MHGHREEAEDLMTMAAAVAAARAQAAADATGAAVEEADIASALTAVCQVATNALEVRPMHLLFLIAPLFQPFLWNLQSSW